VRGALVSSRDEHELRPRALEPESFAPYGVVLAPPPDRAPELVSDRSCGWAMPFSIEGTPQVLVLSTRFGALEVDKLERHDAVTQTFVCVGGAPAVLVVAPGSDHPGEVPPPSVDEVGAFVVVPGSGFVLARGTWHAPDRLPLREPGTTFVCFTETETTFGSWADGKRFVGTQLVSCGELFGRRLRIGRDR